jgi:hypothetical protein
MGKWYFVVRATVADAARRQAFDRWYADVHVPQAMAAFGVEKAWRFWSESDPSIHQAVYEFTDRAALDRALDSAAMKGLIADFDRTWPGIPRVREIMRLAQEAGASPPP